VSHLSDDELVLHFYGEGGPDIVAAESHLRSCKQCAREYEALARTLSAVTPPEFVETAPGFDELPAIRQLIRDRLRSEPLPVAASRSQLPGEPGLIALVWLVPVLYPFSFQALFSSARLAQEHVVAVPLTVLTLMWACAGPFVAVFALNRMGVDLFDRATTRLLAFGALLAAISPALFLQVSRVGPGLPLWYLAVTVVLLMALFRWPNTSRSTVRLLYVHRLSALVITVFALAHISNQVFGFVSLSSYAATRDVLRVGYQQPAIRTLLLWAVAIQIATGVAMGMKKVRAGAFTANLQAVSGWYLALFLLTHVFSGLMASQYYTPPVAATSVEQFNLLANVRSTAQLPFFLLGVAAFFFHAGVYARLAAMAFLAEASVRRLSYAAMFVGTTAVVTIGMALCGIHLLR
jgi:succinate dehydrogenase/fumarate reductase cytochrome b subunit